MLGSSEIPLLSLTFRKHFLLDVSAKFSQEVWYNFGTCVRLQAHNDKLNLNGHFSQFISYLGNVLDATRIHWFRAFRVSNVNIVAGSVKINMCTTKRIGFYFSDKNTNLHLNKIEKNERLFALLLPPSFDELIYYYVIRPSFCIFTCVNFIICWMRIRFIHCEEREK